MFQKYHKIRTLISATVIFPVIFSLVFPIGIVFADENGMAIQCLIPDSLGDSSIITIGQSSSVEKTLQQILNDAGYVNNVNSEQKGYQTWNTTNSSTTIEIEFVDQGEGTANGNVFGYYTNGDKSTFIPLFRTNNNINPTYTDLPVFSKGQKITLNILDASSLSFVIVSQAQNSLEMFSTEINKNNDSKDHVIAYNAKTSSGFIPNTYILAFEDLSFLGDADYNDVVVSVKVLSCNNTNPVVNTPPTITLVGANPLQITINTVFTDPGATATDTEDGDATTTAHIIVTGTVNASTTGSYILTYSVTDSGGLGATTTREVIVSYPSNPEKCTIEVVSDVSNEVVGGEFAVVTYSENPRWTASIPGATWIWKTFLVPNPEQDEIQTFTKTFNVNSTSTVTSALLTVATDNSYQVSINGQWMGTDGTEFNYFDENKDVYNVADKLIKGQNLISLTVKNWAQPEGTPQSNPAGLLYKLTINTEDPNCNEPPAENTPPIITLIGANPLQITVNTPFVDPGATATDTEDGDATTTAHIIVTGTVNASTTGSYILTYSVTDSGGLSTSITRDVVVSATTTPPVVPPVNPPGGDGGGGSSSGGRRHPVVVGEILGATSCSYLRDYLKIDWVNDPIEVLKLQSFLNVFEKENLSLTGVYDQETFKAVEKFQTKYSEDILQPWGEKVTTGFVYILTKKKINEIYCNILYPLSQTDQNEIDVFRSSDGTSSVTGNTGLETTITSGSEIGSLLNANNTSSLSENISSVLNGSPVVELKDSSQSILRNAAISLFSLPQRMFDRLFDSCGYTPTLLLLILIALAIIIIKMFTGSGKNSDKHVISDSPIVGSVAPEKESPIIILPGVMLDEEIIIENPEEGPEDVLVGTLDLRSDQAEDKKV
ncbi:MAG: immunoglobulin-like domain-containing protein [Patescibacteria group bacterium]